MGNNRKPFEPDTVFHVYNHGNANDQIFKEDKNYNFFLKKYREYIPSVADTYAYCLMPNHFHLMVRVKNRKKIMKLYKEKNPQGFGNPEGLDSQNLSNFYYNREGSLFRNTTKRIPVKNNTYFTQLIRYIHRNPVKHGFVAKITNWPYSSFRSLLSKKPTSLERKEVLNWFGGREEFIRLHRQI